MLWLWNCPPPSAAAIHFSSIPISFFLFLLPRAVRGRPATALQAQRPLSSAASLPTSPDTSSSSAFDLLLRGCRNPRQSRLVHSLMVTSGALHGSAFLASRLVSVYSRIGHLANARAVFLGAVEGGNCVLWNSVLRMYLSHGHHGEALVLYCRMRRLGVLPDGFTFPIIVRCCASIGSPALCKAVHAHAVAAGYSSHLHVDNELVLMYGGTGNMDVAQQVFESMTVRNVISWNTLLSGFSVNQDSLAASNAFRMMEREGYEPNAVTWTSLLSAHARCGENGNVLKLFSKMRARGVAPTPESVSVALAVCTNMGASNDGKVIHSFVIRDGVEDYVFVRNSLICFYGRLGNREDAEHLFLRTKVKTLVSWNALISCYAGVGLYDKAYEVFLQLEGMSDIRPNLVSWSAVIGGFAAGGKVEQSLQLFRQMQGAGIGPNAVTVVTILSACAETSALSLGYGVNGFAENALRTFHDLINAGFVPDGISFVAVLSACGYAGYVTEGRWLFDQMICKYKLSPWMEHYACMVDLLGRAGLLEEAKQLLEKMPFKPNICVWGALLNSCRIYRNTQIAEEAVSHIFALELETAGTHMILSNIYASCGRWDDSASMRVLTKEKGLKKRAGQSWIELKKRIYTFSAGFTLPPEMENIYIVLEELNHLVRSEEQTVAYDQLSPYLT
ncbi:hypothetical protein Taro_040989 [Colocasia esculenta]|uniref:Pentatricopeptide repeat-containing protein n=1 Tax=Colocasia esculenta TaxID=4460 RepID=A0A843WKB2_COLES|nr:hypothetical protein [Colocasia esculenta]